MFFFFGLSAREEKGNEPSSSSGASVNQGDADYLCHSEKLPHRRRLFETPAGISGSSRGEEAVSRNEAVMSPPPPPLRLCGVFLCYRLNPWFFFF